MAANPLPCPRPPLHGPMCERKAIPRSRFRKPAQKAGLARGAERILRPESLGNPRREAEGATCSPRSEAERLPARQRGSLDNGKQVITNSEYLAISVLEWSQLHESKWDVYRRKVRNQGDLLDSIQKITDFLARRQDKLESLLFNPANEEFFTRHHKLDGRLQNALVRNSERLIRRRKDWVRLQNCQSQWIGFEADCCGSHVAVPIGCNHRLCFLCNAHRAEKFRKRIRTMFDRLQHPLFLTLTIPNLRKLSKRSYSRFRAAWNKFRKDHKMWIKGGCFAIETTYNNQRDSKSYKTWHLHAHVLIDSASTLPICRCHGGDVHKAEKRYHRDGCEFIRFKRRLEFDWFLLTGGRKHGWAAGDFDYWFRQTQRRDFSSPSRHQFNSEARRVIDVRRVTDREKAALEVLKYVTKASHFAHVPRAVEQFMTAARGARMLQTFGSWYGFQFDDDVNRWEHLECTCGKNEFHRMPGLIYREGVFMDDLGVWRPREEIYARGMGPPG